MEIATLVFCLILIGIVVVVLAASCSNTVTTGALQRDHTLQPQSSLAKATR